MGPIEAFLNVLRDAARVEIKYPAVLAQSLTAWVRSRPAGMAFTDARALRGTERPARCGRAATAAAMRYFGSLSRSRA